MSQVKNFPVLLLEDPKIVFNHEQQHFWLSRLEETFQSLPSAEFSLSEDSLDLESDSSTGLLDSVNERYDDQARIGGPKIRLDPENKTDDCDSSNESELSQFSDDSEGELTSYINNVSHLPTTLAQANCLDIPSGSSTESESTMNEEDQISSDNTSDEIEGDTNSDDDSNSENQVRMSDPAIAPSVFKSSEVTQYNNSSESDSSPIFDNKSQPMTRITASSSSEENVVKGLDNMPKGLPLEPSIIDDAKNQKLFEEGELCAFELPSRFQKGNISLKQAKVKCKVLRVIENEESISHQVLTKWGILNHNLSYADLNHADAEEKQHIEHMLASGVTNQIISMLDIGEFLLESIVCQCRTSCSTQRCPCIKAQKTCSEDCAFKSCGNHVLPAKTRPQTSMRKRRTQTTVNNGITKRRNAPINEK